jgi:hypothetical protein
MVPRDRHEGWRALSTLGALIGGLSPDQAVAGARWWRQILSKLWVAVIRFHSERQGG